MGNSNGYSKVYMQMRRKQLEEGDTVPNVTIKARIRSSPAAHDFDWRDVKTIDLFKKKKVVLFAIAGAFSTVCACDHIPSFDTRYENFKNLGIDEVYCVAVNDAFVIRHFGLSQGMEEEMDANGPLNPGNFKRVKLIPDGSASFTRAMGMSVRWDKSAGFGERSWRYSAYIDDTKIVKMFKEDEGKVEDDAEISPGHLLVSDGKHMLDFLYEYFARPQPRLTPPKQHQ